MKNLSLTSVAVLSTLLVFTPARAEDIPRADPEDVGLSSERLARFSAAIEKGVDAGHFPGVVAGVVRNGKLVFLESYGQRDKKAGVPMQDDTIFRMASMTKAVTGVAVMILYEEGHFTLNDPVSTYIPSFKDARALVNNGGGDKKSGNKKDKKDWSEHELKEWLAENWYDLSEEEQEKWLAVYNEKANAPKSDAETAPLNRQITIRDLLRHTAGISYNMGDIWVEGDDLEQLVDKLAAQPMKSQPGTRFEYGLSMDVLARLVEVVSGQSYDVFLKERIFDPLDMQDTGFYVPKGQAERLVKMPQIDSAKGKGKVSKSDDDSYLSPPVILMGGTGLVSTTMDYLRFCQMLLNNGELYGSRILSRKSVELMHANHMNDVTDKTSGKSMEGDFLFGLTFGVKGNPGDTGALGSEGSYYWAGAYGTTFWIDPKENLAGVFMVNGVEDKKEAGLYYGHMLEHFTYQAIID
ncbi:MAG: serine hydrolase domain-containing protein [Woeseiaceae bacterium]